MINKVLEELIKDLKEAAWAASLLYVIEDFRDEEGYSSTESYYDPYCKLKNDLSNFVGLSGISGIYTEEDLLNLAEAKLLDYYVANVSGSFDYYATNTEPSGIIYPPELGGSL